MDRREIFLCSRRSIILVRLWRRGLGGATQWNNIDCRGSIWGARGVQEDDLWSL